MSEQLHKLARNELPILIAGPTASGKSALGLAFAQERPSVIINADALQVYAMWQVLSARPDAQELSKAPHRLYGHLSAREPYSVGHWLREVEIELAKAHEAQLRPIILGGTGLYFMALTQGLVDIPDIPHDITVAADKMPLDAFGQEIAQSDPQTAAKIDMLNPARTRRAWEVLKSTGKGLADWQAQTPAPLLALSDTNPLMLNAETDWLNTRIDMRMDQMIENGALNECQRALDDGDWDQTLPSCQAIGAKELVAHLSGQLDLRDAARAAKTQTRQYAKRQRTWFRGRMKQWTQLKIDASGVTKM